MVARWWFTNLGQKSLSSSFCDIIVFRYDSGRSFNEYYYVVFVVAIS